MGMGYGANFAYILSDENIQKIVPEEWDILQKSADDHEDDLDFYLSEIVYDYESVPDNILAAADNVIKMVEAKTGMRLELCYHNSEEHGDRYDDVNGPFWAVENAFVPNPAISDDNHELIEQALYTTFG